ncbi:MAG: UbiA family prenyltransferase, partial [bacterium]
MSAAATGWTSWLRLVRPPNLPTVPGDPLAGFVLALGIGGTWDIRILWVMLASLAIYGCGLILNDVADYEVDLRERPKRPIPCGAVRKLHALLAGLLLGAAGIALAYQAGMMALVAASLLLALVLIYDFLMPRGSV